MAKKAKLGNLEVIPRRKGLFRTDFRHSRQAEEILVVDSMIASNYTMREIQETLGLKEQNFVKLWVEIPNLNRPKDFDEYMAEYGKKYDFSKTRTR